MPIRKKLPRKESRAIEKKLPKLDVVVSTVLSLSPDFISIKFSPGSSVPVAAVCLRDAVEVLCDVKFALFEAFAHKVWFDKHESVSKRWVGVHFARFFADDAALRLYSASEHLATAIIKTLELSRNDLAKHRNKKRASQKLESVSQYLLAEKPAAKLTKSLQKLLKSKQWNKTIDYRNLWVHTQPPLIGGVGIVYERRDRWIVSKNSIAVTFGGGDKPQYSITKLLGTVQASTLLFSAVIQEAVSMYIEVLSEHGIQVTKDNMSVYM